jgi:4-diphosphocytidyl-2-C-methyl-D-erythritol kinase
LVEGRGEIVTKIESRNDLRAILVIPTNLGISTPEAFASLDHERLKNQAIVHKTTNANLCQMYAKPVASWSYFNDFSSILHKYNELYENLANFSSQVENCFGEVSGSGSTYYFLSDNDEINQLLPVLNERFQTQVTNICVKCLHRW